MEHIKIYKVNEVYLQLEGVSLSIALELKDYFSFKTTNYFFQPKYKSGNWDGRVSYYGWQDQSIPLGLLSRLVKFLKKHEYSYEFCFETHDLYNEITEDEFTEFYHTIFNNSAFYPRDYQHLSIKVALNRKRGIIESPTGSGKSLNIYAIIRFLLAASERKVLLIVPNISLVNQMFSDFVSYGWIDAELFTTTIFHGSKRIDWSKPIIISTWQSLKDKSESFFEKFGSVLCDEAHSIKDAKCVQTILKKCVNADYRIGLTGTIPDEIDLQYAMFGFLGPRIFQMNSSELIDQGILSKITIANLLIQYPSKLRSAAEGISYQAELKIIEEYEERYKVFDYILKNIDQNHNVLILCREINHLKHIIEYVKNLFPKRNVEEIYGKTEAEDRENIRISMEDKSGSILVGTFATLSTGLNIKKLHHIIFASSTKSKIQTLQSIGRGLRTHDTKEKVLIWDIIDDLSIENGKKLHKNYIYKHWEQRIKYYNSQGFVHLTKKIKL